jgi:hypothetical protein
MTEMTEMTEMAEMAEMAKKGFLVATVYNRSITI